MEQLVRIFVQEASDLLEVLDMLLLDIEENPAEDPLLARFMHSAHTLKGSAGTVGFSALSGLAHQVEDIVSLLQDNRITPVPELFDTLFQALDVLRRSLSDLAQGKDEPQTLDEARRRLQRWSETAEGQVSIGIQPPPDELVLGEYDQVRIRVLRNQGKNFYRLSTSIRATDDDPSAAAIALLKGLREQVDVVTTRPGEGELEQLNERAELTVLVGSHKSASELRSALAGESWPDVQVTEYELVDGDSALPHVTRDTVSLPFERTVRVEVQTLDELLRLVGELVTSGARLDRIGHEFSSLLGDDVLAGDIDSSAERLGQLASDLQGRVIQSRMVPISRLYRAAKRHVRGIARRSQRTVHLTTEGEQTEIDKGLVDSLVEPLGELVEVLVVGAGPQAGPDDSLVVSVSARRGGNQVFLRVESSARAAADQIRRVAKRLWNLGVPLRQASTAEGVRCLLQIPVTSATIPVMMVDVGDETFAIPLENVQETLKIHLSDIATIAGVRTGLWRGRPLPLVFLRDVLHVSGQPPEASVHVVVASIRDVQKGLVVDRLLGKRDIVVKPLSSRFGSDAAGGSTILGDGTVALILDLQALFDLDSETAEPQRMVS